MSTEKAKIRAAELSQATRDKGVRLGKVAALLVLIITGTILGFPSVEIADGAFTLQGTLESLAGFSAVVLATVAALGWIE